MSRPALDADDIAAAAACVASGWISSTGAYLDEFERSWAAVCGRRHGIAVSNGTAALEVALAALPVLDGRDEVIVPSFTIISCVIGVLRAGLRPVFVDVDPDTWCLDVDQVAERIGPRTRAVMVVHMYGHPADMIRLTALCAAHDVAIVEDAAEAHGARVVGEGVDRVCGSYGVVSTFSFYANKLITTGEGGMVVTDDDDVAARARRHRNLGFVPERRFLHPTLAHNFRMTNLQAALGVNQVKRLDRIVAAKRRQGERYRRLLEGVAGLHVQQVRVWARPVYWMFGLTLGGEVSIDAVEFARQLAARGVETRPFFLGMHEQPSLRDAGLLDDRAFPVTTRLARRGLYVPSSNDLTDAEQDEVVAAVIAVLGATG